METKKTLVVGASENPDRYANKATRMLQEYQIPVVAFGRKKGEINTTLIQTDFPKDNDFHTITLYLSAKNQVDFYEKIIHLHPKRVIFNPGAENPEFQTLLQSNGIEVEVACTLVLLRTKMF